jgi:hypothetical protein
MKKQIIIGCFISILVLLLVPSIPAISYTMIKEANIETISNEIIQNEDIHTTCSIEEIKEILSDILSNDQSINSLNIFDGSIDQDFTIPGNEQPLFFPFLGIIIYLLIFYILFLILVTILRNIFDFFGKIIDNIKSKILNFVTLIINVVVILLTFIFNVLKATGQIMASVGLSILSGIKSLVTGLGNLIVLSIQGLITIIVLLIRGIGGLIRNIWKGLGIFFRLMIDIFNLILDAVFPNVTM